MTGYLDCWTAVATALLSQALADAPELTESLPKPMAGGMFGFEWTLTGEEEGRFVVLLDAAALETPLLGEGVDQRAGWGELLREVANAAAGDMLPKTGRKCHIDAWKETTGTSQISRAFQLKSTTGSWMILVRDETHARKVTQGSPQPPEPLPVLPASVSQEHGKNPSVVSPGIELLLDVELEAALRFGCRELPLGEILDLGAGDVVELDRHVADPVDLLVGDRIVARGEVVLVNGNFGLRVTEVAAPRKRLENIRCLF